MFEPAADRNLESASPVGRLRARYGASRRTGWLQLRRYLTVGASGYVVNLAVFTTLVTLADAHHLVAAFCSFVVAASSNFLLNRGWTFREHHLGTALGQAARFLMVSVTALAANLAILELLVQAGAADVTAQAIAIITVTPISFWGNKRWSFGC
jgi:putative flippase GtrA